MRNLVEINNGQPVTNSLLVAEKFGKEHKNVLQIIQNLAAESSAAKFFVETTYENRGKQYPMYIMNRDGFSLLVMGFTGERALQFKLEYIDAFNRMGAMLSSDDYILARSQEILRGRVKALESEVAQQQEVLEIKDRQIERLLPDADYTRRVLVSKDTFTTTQIAKELGLGAPTLNKKLRQLKVQYKQNGQWLLFHKHQDKGYARVNTYTEIHNGETRTYHSTVWTEKGRQFIHDLLKKA